MPALSNIFLVLQKHKQQSQCRINHCAGGTMGGGPAARGGGNQLPIFYHNVLASER